jgi:hypothetical protein
MQTRILLFALLLLLAHPHSLDAAAVNLAIGKPTAQSSLYQNNAGLGSSRGVDGFKYDTSLFATNEEDAPWWEVDLGAVFEIDNVILYNRVDCCQERVRGIEVMLSTDGVNYSVVYTHGSYVFRNQRVDVGGLRARWVRVALPAPGILHLQEVEVYQWGTWQPPSPTARVLRTVRAQARAGQQNQWTMNAEGYPSIEGDWTELPGHPVRVTQRGGGFTATCTYRNPQGGTASWRMDGTLSRDGKLQASMVHTAGVPSSAVGYAQQRSMTLGADGGTLRGNATFTGGGHSLEWRRTAAPLAR